MWFYDILSLKFIWEWSFLTHNRKELSCIHKIAYMYAVFWWNTGDYKDEKRKRNWKWVVFSIQWSVMCIVNDVAWVINEVLCNIFFLGICVCVCVCEKLSQVEKKCLVPWNSKIRGLCCMYSFLDIYTVNYKTCPWEHSRKLCHFLVVITDFMKTGTSLLLFIFYTVILLRKEF